MEVFGLPAGDGTKGITSSSSSSSVVQGVPKVSLHFLQNSNSGKQQEPKTQLIKRRFWDAVVSRVFGIFKNCKVTFGTPCTRRVAPSRTKKAPFSHGRVFLRCGLIELPYSLMTTDHPPPPLDHAAYSERQARATATGMTTATTAAAAATTTAAAVTATTTTIVAA